MATDIYKGVNFILTVYCSVGRHQLKPKNLEHSKELWVRKAVVCGYSAKELPKTCAHKESVTSSVPEYKVETLYSGTGTVPEFWRGYLEKKVCSR